jgi:hypothetical protein
MQMLRNVHPKPLFLLVLQSEASSYNDPNEVPVNGLPICTVAAAVDIAAGSCATPSSFLMLSSLHKLIP